MGEDSRVAVCALSLALPQDQVAAFLNACRRSFAVVAQPPSVHGGAPSLEGDPFIHEAPFHHGRECWITLVVDEWEGLHDLSRLATSVDVLSFAPQRRGFGAARSTAVQEARTSRAVWSVIVDADGQHHPTAIERVLLEVEQSSWAAAIPQRTMVDLPLKDSGDLNRKLAERFESYFVALACNRPDLTHLDMQPGIFFLGQPALEVLSAKVHSNAYAWDVEATYHLLQSGLPLGFPTIETRPQAATFFSTEDGHGILRFLASLRGAQHVREAFTAFSAEAWVQAEYSRESLDLFGSHLEAALGA